MLVVLILYWATCILALNTTKMIHNHPPTRISLQHLSQRHWTNWNLHLHVTLSRQVTLKWKLDLCCLFYLYTIYSAHIWKVVWFIFFFEVECEVTCERLSEMIWVYFKNAVLWKYWDLMFWTIFRLFFFFFFWEMYWICFLGCPASLKYKEIWLRWLDLN